MQWPELTVWKTRRHISQYSDRWSVDTCPRGDELRNAEGYFVNKLVTKFPFEISDKCLELKEITLDDIKAYIEVKKDPHSRKNIGIAKWGG